MKKIYFLFVGIVLLNFNAEAQSNSTKDCKVTVYCNGHTGAFVISKSEAISVSGITAVNDCDKNSIVQIVSYDFTSVNGTTQLFHGKGDGTFSKDMLDAMKNLPAGKKIYIDNIHVKYPDGTMVKKVGGLTLTIK